MDVQKIVDTLAEILKRPVTLEAPDGRLLAYSLHNRPVDAIRLETLLKKGASRATIDFLRDRGVYGMINSSAGLVRIPAIPEISFASRVAAAVRHEGTILAYLWAVDDGLELPAPVESTVGNLLRKLAMELLQDKVASRLKEGQMVALVGEMIAGSQSDEVLQLRARLLGQKLRGPFQVIVVRAKGARLPDRILEEIGRGIQAHHEENTSTLSALVDDEIVFILFADAVRRYRKILDVVKGETARYRSSVVAGIGSVYEALSLVRRSYHEAVRALELAAKLGVEAVCIEYRTLAVYEVISCLPACKEGWDFGREAVGKLVAYDRTHGSSLLATLEAFLDFYGKRSAAAARLRVHPNTLDYRVRRIQDMIKLDLDDPNVRFLLQLWTKAHRLAAGEGDLRENASLQNVPLTGIEPSFPD